MPSRVGTFTGPNSATQQTITGVPFEPRIELIATTARDVASFGNDFRQSFGAGVSSSERVNINGYVRDNNQNSLSSSSLKTNILAQTNNANLYDLVSQNSDGFTVGWDLASSAISAYLAIGGDSVDREVGFFDLTTSPGTQTVTTAIAPSLVILSACDIGTTEGPQTHLHYSIGAADNAGGLFSIATYAQSAVGVSNTASYVSATNALVIINSSVPLCRISSVAMLANGFQVTKGLEPSATTRINYIALGGIGLTAKVGSVTQPAAVGTQAYTWPGFQPDCLMTLFGSVIAGSMETVVVGATAGVGFSDAQPVSVSTVSNAVDGNTLNYARRRFNTSDCLMAMGIGNNSNVNCRAQLDQFDPTGFTLDWTVTDAVARVYGVIAIKTDSPIEPAALALSGASDMTLSVQGSATITLDIATALGLASGEDLSLLITMGTDGIEPGALALEGASDIELSWTENVTLEIEPAELGLNGGGVSGLNCQCLTVSTQYEFGAGTQIVDIITEAFERCGIEGPEISGTMLDSARRSLQYMFVDWANDGPNLFLTYLYTIDLVPGTLSYTLPENTIYVVNAATRQTNGSVDTDLLIGAISRAEYLALPRKSQTSSRPTQFYLERSRVPVIYPWPVLQENSECQLLLYLLRATSDIEKFCGAIDGPQRIMNAAAAGLAAKLATKYAWERRQALKEESNEAYALMTGEDRERVPYRVTINNPWGV